MSRRAVTSVEHIDNRLRRKFLDFRIMVCGRLQRRGKWNSHGHCIHPVLGGATFLPARMPLLHELGRRAITRASNIECNNTGQPLSPSEGAKSAGRRSRNPMEDRQNHGEPKPNPGWRSTIGVAYESSIYDSVSP